MTEPARRVLIAHQSTIPHYRVRFYELLEEMRPQSWTFDVVFDTRESDNPTIYREKVDYRSFKFPILDTRTSRLLLAGRQVLWQHFWWKARHYDAIVTDTHLANLTYPAVNALRLAGKKHVFWGHVRDMNVASAGAVKRTIERVKSAWLRRCDAFFAYTDGGRRELQERGFNPARIHVLNNTIDTRAERDTALQHLPKREEYRLNYGVAGKTVLLHVGRLLPDKRIDFLVHAFEQLHHSHPEQYHLFVVGSGPEEEQIRSAHKRLGDAAITYFGPVTEREMLAPIFTASDYFIMPGYVGLAPLQAFCYDLPTVAFDLPVHSPEWEYVNETNSYVLPASTSSAEFARDFEHIEAKFSAPVARTGIYDSIRHLTLENMAIAFVKGINSVLGIKA